MVVTEDTVEAEQEGDNMIQGDLIMVGGKRRPVNFMERIYNVMFNKKPLSSRRNNERLLELLKPTRYKPDNVEQMARETKFTKEEVKCLYRAFKQECPTGTKQYVACSLSVKSNMCSIKLSNCQNIYCSCYNGRSCFL